MFDFLSEIDTGNLASDSKWQIIRAGIEIGVTSGLSMAETARELRAGGLAFANDPFREMFRELSGYRAEFSYVTKLAADFIPNPALMANSLFPIDGEYGYVGQAFTVNPQTGLLEARTFRVDSDELLSRSEAQAAIEEYVLNNSPRIAEQGFPIDYIGAVKNI